MRRSTVLSLPFQLVFRGEIDNLINLLYRNINYYRKKFYSTVSVLDSSGTNVVNL